MKRVPYQFSQDSLAKKNYWRSLDEAVDAASLEEDRQREFPEGAAEMDPVSRRSFLGLVGATAGLAGMVACRRPEEKILPYTHRPEGLIPGNAEYYASAMTWGGTAVGLLMESHEGRPTKVEGNPRHPDSLGSANIYLQATVLDLYDVDRSKFPRQNNPKGRVYKNTEEADAAHAAVQKDFATVAAALKERGDQFRKNNGTGLAILTEAHRSPTLAAQLADVKKAFPNVRIHRFEPLSRQNVRDGSKLAFGKVLEPVLNLRAAKVVVSLESDFLQLEGATLKHARGFADGRKVEKTTDTLNRLYVVESAFSVTGANADHRLRVPSRDVAEYAFSLARELGAQGVNLGELSAAVDGFKGEKFEAAKKSWVKAVAKDLVANKGASLVLAGQNQPAAVHAAVALINHALENTGRTVKYVKAFDDAADDASSIMALSESMKKKEVDTLIILGGNPVFTAPGDADFAAALGNVPNSYHVSFHNDETSEAATWHINRAHDLETWSDVRSEDGTYSVVQPLIAPIFGGKTDAEVLQALLGNVTAKAHDLVKAAWQALVGPTVDAVKGWRLALHDGVVASLALPVEAVSPNAADVAAAVKALPASKADGFEVTFRPDSHAYDGRFTNNGWLQEMPDPMTKLTWDNGAWFSVATFKKLNLVEGDLVTISVKGGKSVKLPAIAAPGQADDSVAITVGQGRTNVGRVGEGVGFNTYPIRTSVEPWIVNGATVVKSGGEKHKLARTQEHHSMEGRPLVREATVKEWMADPSFPLKEEKGPAKLSLYPDWQYNGNKWGMAIDLNACIGCNACMVACQAENNIPLVGKWGVAISREMHWIRVDRYYTTPAEKVGDHHPVPTDKSATNVMSHTDMSLNEPEAVFQPIPCMQCETAPCETVCPVAATTHSPEGLNDMAYNRCIGTRYCANNCPYKVRRFNFLNYAKDFAAIKRGEKHGQFFKEDYQELRRMQFNPDVTVRTRGVMEKCNYCVQRINEVKIASKRENGRPIKDGEIVTACQQTCPTGAIHFGDMNLADGDVAKTKRNPRNYGLLEELNTRPRTTFLAKVRNPNRELEA